MSTLFRTGHIATKLICGCQSSPAGPISASHRPQKFVPSFDVHADTLMLRKSFVGGKSGIYDSVHGPITCAYISKGINVSSRRLAHTDVSVPNFDTYRPKECLDPEKPARATEDGRRFTPYSIFYGIGGAVYLLAAKEFVQKSVLYKSMAADQRALACIEINLNDIALGQTKTFEWQGKPVFVKHRTEVEIKREKAVAVSELRHAESDDQRVQKDEWSVVIGICTHLGCVPIANAGDYGGYYCPCHGSHYDGSGRIRRGPAPLNLTVPKYVFKDDTLVIG